MYCVAVQSPLVQLDHTLISSVFDNLSVTADFQTQGQSTAAAGALPTRKQQPAGEEQAKSNPQGEAGYKHCTTSESLCILSLPCLSVAGGCSLHRSANFLPDECKVRRPCISNEDMR